MQSVNARIVLVFVVFMAVTLGVGILFADSLPTIPGFGLAPVAMFIAAWVAIPLFILLVVVPSNRRRPE